jgi:integrase
VETDALRDTTIEKANTRFAEAAGLKHITIHEFRHSHASILANAGINIQEVARRLGHADIKETWQTYSHLYPSEADRAIDALDYAHK